MLVSVGFEEHFTRVRAYEDAPENKSSSTDHFANGPRLRIRRDATWTA
jgi:hypothetical protein